jgi:hypothetical protein
MLLLRVLAPLAALCLVVACERSDPLAARRLQLLVEENARLVMLVEKTEPAKATPTVVEPGEPAEENIKRLEEANERLRSIYRSKEKADAVAFNLSKRSEIERVVEEIRGLKFKQPVDYDVLGRTDIKAALTKRLSAVFSEEEFEEQANALARLGLMPEKFPLREKLISLLGEQVAAFFDQHEHKLYMYDDATLENSMNQMILAHELMHAMQDQHFSLKKLPLEEKRNDDRAVGAASLVEGEATLVMMDYLMRNPSARMILDNVGAMFVQNMDELVKAPRILRESLIFPYQDGLAFCIYGYERRGWEALTTAYANPPASTSQILHPEKYWRDREDPIAVTWPEVKFRGKLAQWDNVLGELGVRILFSDWHAPEVATKAAAGWRGDRYLSFESGDSLVWKSLWASPDEAREFFDAEKDLLGRRYKVDSPAGVERRWEVNSPRALRLSMNESNEVILIDAASAETAAALEAQFGK